MANGETTAGQVIQGVGPMLNLVPYVGPLLSAAASIGGGALQAAGAKKQKAEAERIRQQALNTQKQPLQGNYLAALHQARMKALSGLPGIDVYKGDLASQLADQIRYIRMAAPGGNAALSAMSAAVQNQNKGLNDLRAKDATYRSGAQDNLQNTLWDVGDKNRDLELYRDLQRDKGLTAASAMENASMFNKQRGVDTILGGVAQGGNQLFDNMLKLYGGDKQQSPVPTTDSGTMPGIGTASNPTSWLNDYLSNSSPGQGVTSSDMFGAGLSSGGNSIMPASLSGATGNLTAF